MTLNRIKRLKNLNDCSFLTYAVLVDIEYILILEKKYPRIYRKLDKIYELNAMKYGTLKREIKQCVEINESTFTTKEQMFNEMKKLSYFIGL